MSLDGLENLLAQIGRALAWIPSWAIAATVLILAVVIALVVHAALVRLMRRAFGARHPFVATLIGQTKGPTRLALVIFALDVAIQSVSLDANVASTLGHVLRVGLVVLLGWIALAAIGLAAELYLRRFPLDVADNLLARKHLTQVRILQRAADLLVIVITLATALMTFESVRQFGVSLFASAGAAGLIIGFAARPVLSNLIAGVQIAMTQPIRIDDAVVVEGESGRVEEITSAYVVIRLWDWRRMIVPLNYFIEKPFQNWTRESTSLIGSVFLRVDYSVPLERLRAKLNEIVEQSPLWDRQVVNIKVTDAGERTIELRVAVSARSSGDTFDLRCEVREKLIAFLQQDCPNALPRERTETVGRGPEDKTAPS